MGYMYEWLSGLFGTSLSDFLWGYDCATMQYSGGQYYVGIGLTTIALALLSVILFYFVVDHPRWSHRWIPWIIWLVATSIIGGVIGAAWTLSLFNQGVFGNCLNVFEGNCWMFGLANVIVSAILLFIMSLIAKQFSKANKYTPF